MLTYTLENSKKEHLYDQLYTAIKCDIQSGFLQKDEKLPSKRALAIQLGVSVMTVETAYEKLLSEGYIYSQNRKGFFVSPLAWAKEALEKQGQFAQKNAGQSNIRPEPTIQYDLCTSEMQTELFPFSVWARILRKTLSLRQNALMRASPPGGCTELKEAIAAWLLQCRGLHVFPEQIIVGAGTDYLYTLIFQLLGRTPLYAVEDPGYTKISRIYQSLGASISYIPLDSDGIQIAPLTESGATVAHVTPSHQYPTGIVMSASRRYELLSWVAAKEERYIIEDDYDSEFRLHGKPLPPLKSIDGTGQVIYINSFTKTLSSTMRISYMVLPPRLLEVFNERLQFYASTVSTVEQYTLSSFISEGFFEKHINRLRTHYRAVKDALVLSLKKSALSPYITLSGEDAGLHFLLHLKPTSSPLDSSLLEERLAAHKVRVSFLHHYAHNSPQKTQTLETLALVVNYSSLHLSDIDPLVKTLEAALLP